MQIFFGYGKLILGAENAKSINPKLESLNLKLKFIWKQQNKL